MNKILKIKEWLEHKRKQKALEDDVVYKSLADEVESFAPRPTHAIKFEIVNGKVVSNIVKIDKD
jgi:hypothetical protein